MAHEPESGTTVMETVEYDPPPRMPRAPRQQRVTLFEGVAISILRGFLGFLITVGLILAIVAAVIFGVLMLGNKALDMLPSNPTTTTSTAP